MVQIFECLYLLCFCFCNEIICHLMEFFDFSFGFSTSDRCMGNFNGQLRQRPFDLFRSILWSIVKITLIKMSKLQDRFPKGIFHDWFFLIIIKSWKQDHSWMIINGWWKIRLDHGTIFTDWKTWTIFDISLYEHHPVWFTKTSGRAFSCFLINIHMCSSKSCLIHMSLKCWTFQNSGSNSFLHLQDLNDLFDGSFRYFPAELDCFHQDLFIVIRHEIFPIPDPFCILDYHTDVLGSWSIHGFHLLNVWSVYNNHETVKVLFDTQDIKIHYSQIKICCPTRV